MRYPSANAGAARETLAAELLQEAVVASRSEASPFAGAASCGLGDGPELEFRLTDKARALIDQLWPSGLTGEQAQRLRESMERWVEGQDALDRKRNHFMKDFRNAHGYDRKAYGAKQAEEWEAGLSAIYSEVTERRDKQARELLASIG